MAAPSAGLWKVTRGLKPAASFRLVTSWWLRHVRDADRPATQSLAIARSGHAGSQPSHLVTLFARQDRYSVVDAFAVIAPKGSGEACGGTLECYCFTARALPTKMSRTSQCVSFRGNQFLNFLSHHKRQRSGEVCSPLLCVLSGSAVRTAESPQTIQPSRGCCFL